MGVVADFGLELLFSAIHCRYTRRLGYQGQDDIGTQHDPDYRAGRKGLIAE